MAAASVTNPGANFSVVDSSRLARVATWPPTWSPGRDVEQVAEQIAPDGLVPTVEEIPEGKRTVRHGKG